MSTTQSPQRPDYFRTLANVTYELADGQASSAACIHTAIDEAQRLTEELCTGNDWITVRFVHSDITVYVGPRSHPASVAHALQKAITEGQKVVRVKQPRVASDLPRPEMPSPALVLKEFYFQLPDETDVIEAIHQAVYAVNYRYGLYTNLLTFQVRNFKITVSRFTNPDWLVEQWRQRYSRKTKFVHLGGPDGSVLP